MSQASTSARPCPVCGNEKNSFLLSAPPEFLDDDHPVPQVEYPYYRCNVCETVFLSELPSLKTLAIYYDSPAYHTRKQNITGNRADRLSLIWSAYLSFVRPMPVKEPGKHLDYGCGPGDYLVYSASHGWESVGIEFSEESAQEARGRGLRVVVQSEMGQLADDSFDLATLNHSLEHVFDPVETMAAVARKVRPGGTVYVELPSLDSLDYRIFGRYFMGAPLHVQYFSDATMRLLGEKVGLELVKCKNNPWMIQYVTLTFLTYLRAKVGLKLSRSVCGWIAACAFSVMVIPSLVLPLFGINGLARRYFYKKPAN